MAAVNYGDASIILGQDPPTFTVYDESGTTLGTAWTMPDMTSADISVGFDSAETKSQTGEITQVRHTGEYLEATFQFRPKGTAEAGALTSAVLPGAGWTVAITGMKVIRAGKFTDAFNVGGSGILLNRWVCMPSRGSGEAQAPYTTSWTLRRYSGIVATSPVAD